MGSGHSSSTRTALGDFEVELIVQRERLRRQRIVAAYLLHLRALGIDLGHPTTGVLWKTTEATLSGVPSGHTKGHTNGHTAANGQTSDRLTDGQKCDSSSEMPSALFSAHSASPLLISAPESIALHHSLTTPPSSEKVKQKSAQPSLRIIIHGTVCDVTQWQASHPGGGRSLQKHALTWPTFVPYKCESNDNGRPNASLATASNGEKGHSDGDSGNRYIFSLTSMRRWVSANKDVEASVATAAECGAAFDTCHSVSTRAGYKRHIVARTVFLFFAFALDVLDSCVEHLADEDPSSCSADSPQDTERHTQSPQDMKIGNVEVNERRSHTTADTDMDMGDAVKRDTLPPANALVQSADPSSPDPREAEPTPKCHTQSPEGVETAPAPALVQSADIPSLLDETPKCHTQSPQSIDCHTNADSKAPARNAKMSSSLDPSEGKPSPKSRHDIQRHANDANAPPPVDVRVQNVAMSSPNRRAKEVSSSSVARVYKGRSYVVPPRRVRSATSTPAPTTHAFEAENEPSSDTKEVSYSNVAPIYQGRSYVVPHRRVPHSATSTPAPITHAFEAEVFNSDTTLVADRFRRKALTDLAFEHSVPHIVISQVIRPEMAAFMADSRVVVRSHDDEMCCVDMVMFVAEDSPLRAPDVEYLRRFPHLARLQFDSKEAIDAAGLALVAKLTQLERLHLTRCNGVDARGLAHLLKLSQLQHLELRDCDGVGAPALAHVAMLSGLQHLDLTHCHGVDAEGLAEVSKLTELRRLHIGRCDGVDAVGLSEVAKLFQLQHLELKGCDGVDTAGLAEVAKLSQLQHLDLTGCRGVNAAGLAEVSKLSQLRHLNVGWCRGVDAAGLSVVVSSLIHLRYLNLSRCHGVDAAELAELEQNSQLELDFRDPRPM